MKQATYYVETWKPIQKTYFFVQKFLKLGTYKVHINMYSNEKLEIQTQTRKKSYENNKYKVHVH
jgi:hypothetical protein